MFICYDCDKVIGPRVSPTKVTTLTRDMEYDNIRVEVDDYSVERKIPVHSVGYETVSEINICPVCANVPVVVLKAKARVGLHDEKQAPELKVPLVSSAIQSALERLNHTAGSKRATRDCATAIPTIKWFIDENPKFVV